MQDGKLALVVGDVVWFGDGRDHCAYKRAPMGVQKHPSVKSVCHINVVPLVHCHPLRPLELTLPSTPLTHHRQQLQRRAVENLQTVVACGVARV